MRLAEASGPVPGARPARIDGLDLVLDEACRARVRNPSDENLRCAIFSRGILVADSRIRAGEEVFETAPPGPIHVELYAGSGDNREIRAEHTLQARAGRVEKVEFAHLARD